MSFAFFQGEKSIGELVSRLYRDVFPTPTARQQAGDALVQANPQLTDLTQVAPGTKIVVPTTPTAQANPAEVIGAASIRIPSASAAQLSQHLDTMRTSVPAAAASAVANAKATLEVAQAPEVQAAAANDPELATRLAVIAQQAEASIQSAQALQAEFLKAVSVFQARLSPPA